MWLVISISHSGNCERAHQCTSITPPPPLPTQKKRVFFKWSWKKVGAAVPPQGLNHHGGRDSIKSKVPSESRAEVRSCRESGEKQYFSTPFCVVLPPYFIILSSLQLGVLSPWSPSSFTQWSVKLWCPGFAPLRRLRRSQDTRSVNPQPPHVKSAAAFNVDFKRWG